MGAVITFPHSETGVTLYALVFHTDGKVRDVVAPAWDTYATADLGDYDVALTELGTASRIYQFSVPASLTSGVYSFAIYKRAGGSPAEGDLRVGIGSFDYDGSAIVGVGEGVNVAKWLGTAAATPTIAGVPEVDMTHIAGSAVDTGSAQLGVRMVTASDAAGQQVAFQVWEEPISSHSTITLYGGYIEARLDNINTNASNTVTRLGTPSDLGSGATVAANLVDIESQTDDIGVAGAGLTEAGGTGDHLTAIPWNASWDAQVESEVDDALIAKGLDHLVFASVAGTDVADNSIIAKLVSKSATADWDSYANTTDSLEALRDRGDEAWATATGFSTHSAADVWAVATRTLTAIDEDSTTLDLDATIRGAVGLASADLDSQLSALPTAGENADAVWDESTTNHTTSGTFGEQLKTDVDAILLDTNELQADWADGGRLDVILDARASQSSVNTISGNVDAILLDTGTDGVVVAAASKSGYSLASTGLSLVTAWTVNITGSLSGSVGSVTGNVGGNVTGSVGSLATQAKTDVNTEVLDVLATDTFTEPSSVPAATSSLKDKISWVFTLARNTITETSTTQTLKNDAESGNIGSAAVSDDGTTFTRSEWT